MSDTQTIQPGMPLGVTLTAQQWQLVMMLIDTSVSGLVREIQRQCTAHLGQVPDAPAEPMPRPRGNGADVPRQSPEA
jgi:hypothetical protein